MSCQRISHHLRRHRLIVVCLLLVLVAACGGGEQREAKYLQRGKVLFEQGDFVKA